MIYTAHGPEAPHRATLLDTHRFVTEVSGVQTWTRVPGFHISVVGHDWFYICDLALIPECAASALVELVTETDVFGREKWDERLRRAYVEFTAACKSAKIRASLQF